MKSETWGITHLHQPVLNVERWTMTDSLEVFFFCAVAENVLEILR